MQKQHVLAMPRTSCASCTSSPPLLIADLIPPLTQTALYTLSALALATQFTPFLRTRLLGYGKTLQTPNSPSSQETDKKKPKPGLLEWLFQTTVPHAWFLHFYALALALMVASIAGILLPAHLSPLKLVLGVAIPTELVKDELFNTLLLGPLRMTNAGVRGVEEVNWWVILAVTAQVGRRFWEDLTLPRKEWDEEGRKRMGLGGEIVIPKSSSTPSSDKKDGKDAQDAPKKEEGSRMPLPIYLSGMAFYLLLCMSTWADSARTLLTYTAPLPSLERILHITTSPLSLPPLHILLSLPIFLIASGTQNDIHLYLSTLEKYTLPPARSWFSWVLAPHYTMECIIYASMVGMSTVDEVGNGCVLACAVFVWTNLTLLGMRQRGWYGERFGEKVGGRGGTWPWV